MWYCITTYVILTALLGISVNCDSWVRRPALTTGDVSKCYAHLGCVNITKAWYYNYCRSVNLMPEERYIVNTKFLFLNPSPAAQNTLTFDIISSNPDSVKITRYDSKLPLIMLIHDFTSSGYTGWIKQLALVLFKSDRYNIISVDWQQGAQAPFDQAISNARLVALECEILLRMLKLKFCLQMQRVHLIGHGIGAHIAAYIGKSTQQIGRITGLDPTGPKFECMPSSAKLTPVDALFVDVLHTDGEGYYRQGTMQPMGALDYYFNSGHHQPGCKENNQYNNLLRIKACELPKGKVLPGCSHKRVLKYFIEAVASFQCQFIGFRSVSYEEFLKTSCINCQENVHLQCATVSMEVLPSYMRQINAKLFLLTADKAPFCMNPYVVTFNLACNPKADSIVYGHFEMMMVENNSNIRSNTTFNNLAPRELHHGQNETFLAYGNSYRIDYIYTVSLKWIPKNRPWCMGCNNNLYVHNMTITAVKVTSDGTPEVKNDMCPRMSKCNSSQAVLKYKLPLELLKCKYVHHTLT